MSAAANFFPRICHRRLLSPCFTSKYIKFSCDLCVRRPSSPLRVPEDRPNPCGVTDSSTRRVEDNTPYRGSWPQFTTQRRDAVVTQASARQQVRCATCQVKDHYIPREEHTFPRRTLKLYHPLPPRVNCPRPRKLAHGVGHSGTRCLAHGVGHEYR